MANSQLSEVLQHLRRAALLRDGAGLTDGQLLADYLSRREEAAVTALVRRHGPMVWGVCRRVLRNHHDAEDAFQATFLVLVRKAASVVPREMVANWLYGVAHQTALNARTTIAKRRSRERQVTEMPEPTGTEPDLWRPLEPLLDLELSRLPDKYRVAIVLCDLEGKTRREAARQLGVPEGTLAARVARGRVMLAKRLARHGLTVSGGLLAAVLSEQAAAAAPTSLVSSTIKAASLFAAGQAAAKGVISTQVAALTEGVLRTMLLSKLRIAVLGLLTICALGIGVSGLTRATQAADPPPARARTAATGQDDGNLKETLLALEKRIWEAHGKQDADVFKNLMADDFAGTDINGRPFDKAGTLDYVAKFRVVEYVLKDVKVILLNPTSAILSYEVAYKVRATNGDQVESTTRRVTAAWVQRKGRWWYAYCEDKLVRKEGAFRNDEAFWKLEVIRWDELKNPLERQSRVKD